MEDFHLSHLNSDDTLSTSAHKELYIVTSRWLLRPDHESVIKVVTFMIESLLCIDCNVS